MIENKNRTKNIIVHNNDIYIRHKYKLKAQGEHHHKESYHIIIPRFGSVPR